jgi:glucan biosynthesis protein C
MTNVEQKPERLHALDAVRGYALLLGIVLHATISFLPSPTRIWIIEDSHPSNTLGVLFFAIHVFRMTTFFLIAGFFAGASSGIACSALRCRCWLAGRSCSRQ